MIVDDRLETPRLHVTVQNKVARADAIALQQRLSGEIARQSFAFTGLALHHYAGGPWTPAGGWAFRGKVRVGS